MQKINVLFCTLYLAHGGTEKQLMALIDGLDRERFEPHLCCINQSAIEPSFRKDADFLFHQIDCGKLQIDFKSFRNPLTITQIIRLANYIRQNEIDVVVSYFIDPPIFSFFASHLSLRSPRFVVAFRDLGLLRSSHNRLLRFVFHNAHAFLANSLAVKNDYVENDGLPADMITVIGNGLDVDHFARQKEASRTPKIVGIVANLNRHVKRVDIFIRAAAIVAKKHSSISFVVIGEGGLKNDLISLASDLGVADRIKFAGRSYDIAQSLRDVDIGVNTSETEGFANGILEYLAAGIPAVATNTGGNREIIVDNENGFLFPVNNHVELAKRLMTILEDRELFLRLSSNAVRSVKGNFDMRIMVQGYQDFFERLMDR